MWCAVVFGLNGVRCGAWCEYMVRCGVWGVVRCGDCHVWDEWGSPWCMVWFVMVLGAWCAVVHGATACMVCAVVAVVCKSCSVVRCGGCHI